MFAIVQFVASNYVSVELTDVIASLIALAAAVLMLRVWRPSDTAGARERMLAEQRDEGREKGTATEPAGPAPVGLR